MLDFISNLGIRIIAFCFVSLATMSLKQENSIFVLRFFRLENIPLDQQVHSKVSFVRVLQR